MPILHEVAAREHGAEKQASVGQAQLAPRTLAFQQHAPVPLPHVK